MMSRGHHGHHGHHGYINPDETNVFVLGYHPSCFFAPPPMIFYEKPYYRASHTHIHVSSYVPYLVGLFLFGASIAFLAAFVLPIVAKVLLSLVLIAGAVTLGVAAYHTLTR